MTKYIKQLWLTRNYNIVPDSQVTLFVSGKFLHCPQLTQVILEHCHIDDSVPSFLMKAFNNGDVPNLKRIELIHCTVNDYEWPAVPEFSFETSGKLDSSQMQKLLSKLTELTVYGPFDIELVIPVSLENLSVLKLEYIESHNLQQISSILEKGKLPNVSNLSINVFENRVRLQKFLDNFDPNQILKLEKLTLQRFIISADGLKILSKKLAIRLTKLNLYHSSGFIGSLAALFTKSFPTLNTLILHQCQLDSEDIHSLARANVEGKLPQLRHLYIKGHDNIEINNLFEHSDQWNHLTTLAISDINVLNVEPECLTSLEKLILFIPQSTLPREFLQESQLQSVSRQWPRLKVIEVGDEDIAGCIADGVERGMFPALRIVRCRSFDYERQFFFKLLKANISIQRIY